MAAVRYDITFTGRVQGVFFRATCEKLSRDHDVTGWVRNEPDGSVRLVVEGEPTELDRFLDAIRAAKRDNIEDMTKQQPDATDEFDGFTIRR